MKGNRAEIRRRIDEWFAENCNKMIDDLRRLVAVNSVRGPAKAGKPYGEASHEALMLARAMLRENGLTVSNFEDIIITADYGPAPVKLGILAHLDIVEAGAGWETDPFGLTIEEGKIYGRGTSDDKGPAVAAMYAVYCARAIYPELSGGVRLIFGSGEETGCEDIARYIAKVAPPPFVFTPDANFPVVNIEKGRFVPTFTAAWEKDTALPRIVSFTGGKTANIVPNNAEAVIEGFTFDEVKDVCDNYNRKNGTAIAVRETEGKLTLISSGKAAHASKPGEGSNAQTALIGLLAAMPFADSAAYGRICGLSRLFPHGDCEGRALGIAMRDDETGVLTVNFGVLQMNETELTANFDSRTPSCADKIDLKAVTAEKLKSEGLTLTYATLSKSHHTPEESIFVQTLLRIYEEYTGSKGECIAVGGSTYVHEIEGGVAFGCELPGVDNRIHGANEFIGTEQLLVSAKMFTQAILDMCG